ncbi:MarC family protein [Leifsonia sp. H3M29-4]|uniref:MarC family protein n=1 Tax=Salinibacterium metalliresistens TaxID=3031321 RepID=UPI0023DBD8C7|nr:MarC family protein [Salinibacterium metalliresistens]MDF1478819.1 MarC family protein [Salinibacterium metalliresistens]
MDSISAPSLVTGAIALFTITNPIGTLPIFLELTKDMPPAKQRRTAVLVAIAVVVVLVVALVGGTFVLDAFGIDMTAFKIAGNLLVASIGWAMLTAKSDPVAVEPGQSPVVVPLAIPVLAGPGAIALVITFAHEYTGLVDYLLGIATVIVIGAAVALVYAAGPWVARGLKSTGMSVLTRVFGLLLLAIALQAILAALALAFPAWAGSAPTSGS